ncbi:competence protein ComK [Salinicoccus sp. CNSTN-B1]
MKRLHYQIHEETMYIVPVDNDGMIESRIGEAYGEGIECRLNPNKVIERNCRSHSQNYHARKDLSRTLTGISSKVPVIIDLFGSYIYFCTHSDRISENNLFNINHIQSYMNDEGMTRVLFSNNEERIIDISYTSFNNQYLNALKLHYKFNQQKEKYQKKEMSMQFQYPTMGRGEAARVNETIYHSYISYINGLEVKREV